MTTDGSTIAVPAAEVRALGGTLAQLAGDAEDAGARLVAGRSPGPHLQAAALDFLDCHRTAAGALAGELRWLGVTVGAVADSWEDLDGSVLGGTGRAVAR